MSAARSAPPRLAIAMLWVAFMVGGLAHVVWVTIRPVGRTDFTAFYLSAVATRTGGSPYLTSGEEPFAPDGPGTGREGAAAGLRIDNLNPPFQTTLLLPLSRLPYEQAVWVWSMIGLAAGVTASFVTVRTFLPHGPLLVWGPVVALVWMTYLPTLRNVWFDQLGSVLFLGTATIFWLIESKRLGLAASLAGGLAGIKVFAGLFGAYFLVTRRWRALVLFVSTFLATAMIGSAATGLGSYREYVSLLSSVDWHASSWNASLFGVGTRWLGSARSRGLALQLWDDGYGITLGIAVAAGGAFLLVLAKLARSTSSESVRLGIALTCVAMLALSPLAWIHYLPALLPVAACLLASARPGRERMIASLAAAAYFVATSVPTSLYAAEQIGMDSYQTLRTELPAVGLAILALALIWQLARRNAEGAVDNGRALDGDGAEERSDVPQEAHGESPLGLLRLP